MGLRLGLGPGLGPWLGLGFSPGKWLAFEIADEGVPFEEEELLQHPVLVWPSCREAELLLELRAVHHLVIL